ncbi:MAG: PIN domain-containing protein [Balneolaceae bacterium]|nr:MAG: PIN domain-containing protein [Balneolaceae bacterium]
MKILIDTGPIVAFLNKNDQFHSYVEQQMAAFPAPFYTCEAVITESFFLMSRIRDGANKLIELLTAQHIRIQSIYPEHQNAVHRRIQNYSNIPMSFADACLVQMAEDSDNSSIFTLDSDFLIYRTSGGNPLSLISPF